MLVGHYGAALGLAGIEKRLNLGYVVLASMFLDLLLWSLVLLRVETVIVPADYANLHYLQFIFPYSHGLTAVVIWATLGFGLTWLCTKRWETGRITAGITIAGAVVIHWLLDFVVHVPEIPVAGENSSKIGLSLWNHLPIALAVESIITFGGLAIFILRVPMSRGRAILLSSFTLIIVALADLGQAYSPPPPNSLQLALFSLFTNLLIIGVSFLIGRKTRYHQIKSPA